MIADPRLYAGGFRASTDNAVGVLLVEGFVCELTGFAAGGAEQIGIDVAGDACRPDIVVQVLIEAVVTGNIVFLSDAKLNATGRDFCQIWCD